MTALINKRQALSLEFTKLSELGQQLQDTSCSNEQNMLVSQIVECEEVIQELDQDIRLLESEEYFK